MELTRRMFTFISGATLCAPSHDCTAETPSDHSDLKGKIGLTTGSFTRHLSVTPKQGKLLMLDLPKIMRDDLDLSVLDLMTATLPSLGTTYLEQLRQRAEDAGCIVTNLKMNQKNVDMGSVDDATRQHAIGVYKRSIDAAATLGCRWVRPLPRVQKPNMNAYVESYRELIDYAAPKGISLLIENFGWLQSDSTGIPRMIKAVGKGLAASVDTGNWTDTVRYEGLAAAYPMAVTCDFKAFELSADNEHKRYDLQRCFQIGWDAGFRGPWCFEHFNPSLDGLLKGMVQLREMIQRWMLANTKQ